MAQDKIVDQSMSFEGIIAFSIKSIKI